ncbi:thiamine phosphate synthase [Flavobacterium algicola]|uniref:thiamine phosphate synthase n=1 Tax=Flavobacterium algicola TaxID=556529 RepID=UPI001EFCE948|nr:thiamine phosphate synthase [Flavobacterium algicola]MCG9791568.1 thiamine phosphate synthase [Flavobacterium algicola]
MIVISNPVAVENEIRIIHDLLEQGLELFHIRKPAFSAKEMTDYVTAIGLEYSSQLVLHSHHHLAAALGINRIHLTEKARAEMNTKELNTFIETKVHLSTSVHSISSFNALELHFEYAFLSPVYPSISKTNYKSNTDLFQATKSRTNYQTKLIGLGGMEAENILKALTNGFDDVALLGSIWITDQPIKNFKLCKHIVLSY